MKKKNDGYEYMIGDQVVRGAKSLAKIKAEKIHLTLTLGEVDALVTAGRYSITNAKSKVDSYIVAALQKLDAAVNE